MDTQKTAWEKFALNIRIETINALGDLGFGHIGGSMSIVDTLAVLYESVMKYDPENTQWKDRDWLVVSKGHAGPAVYATLALKGFFPKEELLTINRPMTKFPSHCDRNLTPGIDMTTGSLGQGLSVGLGIALGNRLSGRASRTYVILGDGEIQEGQVWEAALYARQQRLDSLIVFIDYNKQQLDGYTMNVNDLGNIAEKFAVFGWHCQDINGHNCEEIYNAIEKAKIMKGQPSVIVLNTIKGKGCSFAEDILNNHHINISKEQAAEAIALLEAKLSKYNSNEA